MAKAPHRHFGVPTSSGDGTKSCPSACPHPPRERTRPAPASADVLRKSRLFMGAPPSAWLGSLYPAAWAKLGRQQLLAGGFRRRNACSYPHPFRWLFRSTTLKRLRHWTRAAPSNQSDKRPTDDSLHRLEHTRTRPLKGVVRRRSLPHRRDRSDNRPDGPSTTRSARATSSPGVSADRTAT